MEKQINIGIFDGDYSNRCLIKALSTKILKNANYLESDSGFSAIDLIKHNKIDLCFINLRLSVFSGAEVSNFLRIENSKSRIIALNSIDVNCLDEINQFDSYVRIASSKFNEFICKECLNFVTILD